MFTRPFSRWRALKPRNIMGNVTGYGSCPCGNTLRGPTESYWTGPGSGKIICPDCYEAFKDAIFENDHDKAMTPTYRDIPLLSPSGNVTGYKREVAGYGICSNESCTWHGRDPRFVWAKWAWSIKDNFICEVCKQREAIEQLEVGEWKGKWVCSICSGNYEVLASAL